VATSQEIPMTYATIDERARNLVGDVIKGRVALSNLPGTVANTLKSVEGIGTTYDELKACVAVPERFEAIRADLVNHLVDGGLLKDEAEQEATTAMRNLRSKILCGLADGRKLAAEVEAVTACVSAIGKFGLDAVVKALAPLG
jgi:hypothetical protein